MSEPKMLDRLQASVGNDAEYRSVNVPGGVVPRVDAVVVTAMPQWLKSDKYVAAHLTPREARVLAEQLLVAARRIEDRGQR